MSVPLFCLDVQPVLIIPMLVNLEINIPANIRQSAEYMMSKPVTEGFLVQRIPGSL